MIEGALILLVGIAIGRVIRLRARPKAYKPKVVNPKCGCRHHFALHDPQTGVCHGGFSRYGEPVNYQREGKVDGTPCSCRKYTGPEPLPEYYAPEIS